MVHPRYHTTPLSTLMGEPSPGVACAGPRCRQRDTARCGLRRLPLCPGRPSKAAPTSGRYRQAPHASCAAAQPDHPGDKGLKPASRSQAAKA